MSTLSPEEAALFGETPAAATPAGDDWGWEDPPAAPPKPSLIMPECSACGVSLNPENGSQRNGVWKHIGCPKALIPAGPPPTDIPVPSATEPVPASVLAAPGPAASAPAPAEKPRRGRPPKVKTETPDAAERLANSEVRAAIAAIPDPSPGQIQTLAPTVIRIELGPETLAVLRALIK